MECKHKAYCALVQPVLENACQVQNLYTQQSIKQLESGTCGTTFVGLLFLSLQDGDLHHTFEQPVPFCF